MRSLIPAATLLIAGEALYLDKVWAFWVMLGAAMVLMLLAAALPPAREVSDRGEKLEEDLKDYLKNRASYRSWLKEPRNGPGAPHSHSSR